MSSGHLLREQESLRRNVSVFDEHFAQTSRFFITSPAKERIEDSLNLLKIFEGNKKIRGTIHDWSFIVFPACLASEQVMYKIADTLSIGYTPKETIGQVFRTENVNKCLEAIKDEKIRNELALHINSARGHIDFFRNSILHTDKDGAMLDNFSRTKSKLYSLLESLDSLISVLYKLGLAKIGPPPVIGGIE